MLSPPSNSISIPKGRMEMNKKPKMSHRSTLRHPERDLSKIAGCLRKKIQEMTIRKKILVGGK